MTDFDHIELAISIKEKKLRQREAEIQRERELLEEQKRALALLSPLRSVAPEPQSSTYGPNALSEEPTVSLGIRDAVLKALDLLSPYDDFTARDVLDRMRNMSLRFDLEHNRSNISHYLREFVKEGLLESRKEGRGRIPARYQKK